MPKPKVRMFKTKVDLFNAVGMKIPAGTVVRCPAWNAGLYLCGKGVHYNGTPLTKVIVTGVSADDVEELPEQPPATSRRK